MDKDGKDEYVFVNYSPDFGDGRMTSRSR